MYVCLINRLVLQIKDMTNEKPLQCIIGWSYFNHNLRARNFAKVRSAGGEYCHKNFYFDFQPNVSLSVRQLYRDVDYVI